MSIDFDYYTGKIEFQNIKFDFVFDKKILRFTPPPEKKQEVRNWFMNEISPGFYAGIKSVYFEEEYLIAKINETFKTIIFFPSHSPFSCYNHTLTLEIKAYIITESEKACFSTIGFNNPEIDYIYPVEHAVDILEHNINGIIEIKTKKTSETKSNEQTFLVDQKKVTVFFGIARKTSLKDKPLELNSMMYFKFEETNDYSFLIRLWEIAKSFLQFLCYRKNVNLPKILIFHAPPSNQSCLYIVNEESDTEYLPLKKGRYIKQSLIAGYEDKILEDISENKLYQRHIPNSYKLSMTVDAAKFIMITAAFEWIFKRCYPNGIKKRQQTINAENIVKNKLDELISNSTDKVKEKYKSFKKHIKDDGLQNKIFQVGEDYKNIINEYGNTLYKINDTILNYSQMGQRIGYQRNNFAHGNLDKDFDNISLIDICFLEYMLYAMQLKLYNIPDENIKDIIKNLFGCQMLKNGRSIDRPELLHHTLNLRQNNIRRIEFTHKLQFFIAVSRYHSDNICIRAEACTVFFKGISAYHIAVFRNQLFP